jgi:hypothetical protein
MYRRNGYKARTSGYDEVCKDLKSGGKSWAEEAAVIKLKDRDTEQEAKYTG